MPTERQNGKITNFALLYGANPSSWISDLELKYFEIQQRERGRYPTWHRRVLEGLFED
jgi:hypothetical protein